MSPKALILGVTGTLGRALGIDLLEHAWEVHGAARFSGDAQPSEFEDRGISVTPFNVADDDPAVLPEVDVVFLEIWDPGRPELHWPINFYGVGSVVERYAGVADFVNGCTINVCGVNGNWPRKFTDVSGRTLANSYVRKTSPHQQI